MTLSDDVIIDAIETSFFLLPEVPGRIKSLNIPGIQGRITPITHPLANMVGAARLSQEDTDVTIKKVFKLFNAKKKAFSWIIDPHTTPTDLANRLTAAGMTKTAEMAGMAVTDLLIPIRVNQAVQIREATTDDLMIASSTMARAFPVSEELARLVIEVLLMSRDRLKSRIYLAFLEEIEEPVGFSMMVYVPDQPIVRLGGATTLSEYRGKGVYSSLLARRLSDALKDGVEAAVIQALSTTSAPICRKHGFIEVCKLEMYTWGL